MKLTKPKSKTKNHMQVVMSSIMLLAGAFTECPGEYLNCDKGTYGLCTGRYTRC